MVAYKLKMNSAEVNRIGKAAALKMVTDTARRTLNRAIILSPVDDGPLRGHNKMRVKKRGLVVVFEVFNDIDYAKAVHEGSPAYDIRPKTKKVLRFTVGGEVVFAKRVHMPARKGRPWLYRALVEVAGREGYKVTRL